MLCFWMPLIFTGQTWEHRDLWYSSKIEVAKVAGLVPMNALLFYGTFGTLVLKSGPSLLIFQEETGQNKAFLQRIRLFP